MSVNTERILQSAVRRLLSMHLESIGPDNIETPNKIFDPEGRDLWIRVNAHLGEDVTWTETTSKRAGIFDYHICVPLNTGTARVYNIAKKISDLFSVHFGRNGLFLLPKGDKIIVRRVTQMKGASSECFSLIVSVTFDFYQEEE